MNAMNERFGSVHDVDERQLRLLMGDWRKGRADRNLLQALQDAYVMVFGVVLIGAMLISSIVQAQQSVAGCETDQCLAARGLLPWAAVAALLASTLIIARMFGPIVASAAEGFWLMDAAIDRRRLLTGRLLGSMAAASVAGAMLGALVAALTGSSLPDVVVWALASGLGAFGLTAFSAAEQGVERRWIIIVLQWLIGLVAVATMVVLVGISGGWFDQTPLEALRIEYAWYIAGAGLVVGVLSAVIAWMRLRRIRRQRLTAGSSLLSGMQGAAFAMDFALIRDILIEHKAQEKGHVRATRGAGSGTHALVLRDVQRLWRNPLPLVTWVASMVVPYAVASLGVGQLNPTISALVLTAVLISFCNSLRVLTRTKGLQRAFPFSAAQTKSAVMVVPGVLALIWAAATVPAFMGLFGGEQLTVSGGITIAVITAGAGFLGAVRWVSAKPADYGGPIVAVGVGAMPPGMMFSLLRGIDMVALVTLPIVFGLPAWVSFVIGAIAFLVLRSGFDKDQMMAQQEEQRRQLEEEKARRQGKAAPKEKIKVQRRQR